MTRTRPTYSKTAPGGCRSLSFSESPTGAPLPKGPRAAQDTCRTTTNTSSSALQRPPPRVSTRRTSWRLSLTSTPWLLLLSYPLLLLLLPGALADYSSNGKLASGVVYGDRTYQHILVEEADSLHMADSHHQDTYYAGGGRDSDDWYSHGRK